MNYFGQFNPPVDKIIHERYFNELENGISIEAGAFDGILDSCTYFFNKYKNWTTYNIEPLPNIFKKLEENRTDNKSINLNIALSNIDEYKFIRNYKHPYLNYDWGNASIEHTLEHRNELEKLSNNTFIEHEVKCLTYNTFIKTHNITHLDLFVLDVEGHESLVLEGMKNCNILPDVFVIEHGHKQIDLSNYFDNIYKLDYVLYNNSYFIKC
jgi:FkbM family methyltransferase